MQNVGPLNSSKQRPPPEILCPPLPSFGAMNLESMQNAFRSVVHCSLQQGWLDREEVGFSPAIVRAGWRGSSLLIFAELMDMDIFNSATKLNQRTWEMGDVFEIFLRSEVNENYVELHITPNNQRLQLHYPDGVSASSARTNGWLDKFMIWDEAFDSKTWVENGKWYVYAEIPGALLGHVNGSIENSSWRFSFGRYDYIRGVKKPVLSSTSPHAEPDFHRQHEWGLMTFKTCL
jgi:hypothetical protein